MPDSATDFCAEDDFFAEEDEVEEDEEVEDEEVEDEEELEDNDDKLDPDAARFALPLGLALGLALLLPEVVALAFGAGGNGEQGAVSEPESHPVGR